jgi:hypothetical protein
MDVMRGRVSARFAAAILVLQIVWCVPALAAEASVASRAQPLGQPLKTILEFGDQYNGGDELYDATITVEEVLRGDKAWEIVKEASASNRPPETGFEYLLARIRFEFSARATPHHYSYTIGEAQFTAAAPDGKEYESPSLAAQPKPSLTGTIAPGSSLEGWVTFLVPRGSAKTDKLEKPLMIFREDVGSVIHSGSGVWFQLYKSSRARGPAKAS